MLIVWITIGRSWLVSLLFLTGDSPRTGSFLFTMSSPLRTERSRSMVFHTFSFIGVLLLNQTQTHITLHKHNHYGPNLQVLQMSFSKPTEPDNSRSLSQIVAKLQEALFQGQRDEVPISVRLLPVVEDQTIGVIGHKNQRHAEFLTARYKHRLVNKTCSVIRD